MALSPRSTGLARLAAAAAVAAATPRLAWALSRLDLPAATEAAALWYATAEPAGIKLHPPTCQVLGRAAAAPFGALARTAAARVRPAAAAPEEAARGACGAAELLGRVRSLPWPEGASLAVRRASAVLFPPLPASLGSLVVLLVLSLAAAALLASAIRDVAVGAQRGFRKRTATAHGGTRSAGTEAVADATRPGSAPPRGASLPERPAPAASPVPSARSPAPARPTPPPCAPLPFFLPHCVALLLLALPWLALSAASGAVFRAHLAATARLWASLAHARRLPSVRETVARALQGRRAGSRAREAEAGRRRSAPVPAHESPARRVLASSLLLVPLALTIPSTFVFRCAAFIPEAVVTVAVRAMARAGKERGGGAERRGGGRSASSPVAGRRAETPSPLADREAPRDAPSRPVSPSPLALVLRLFSSLLERHSLGVISFALPAPRRGAPPPSLPVAPTLLRRALVRRGA